MAETVYIVELKPPAGDDAPHLRLRRALKCLLRSFRLRCVSVTKKPAKTEEGGKADPEAVGAGGTA